MKKRVLLSLVLLLIWVCIIYIMYNKTISSVALLGYFPTKMFICRICVLTCLLLFSLLHVWLSAERLYSYIHDYRYLIAGIVLICFVLCKFNFSSIGMYDSYIEPGMGSEFCSPVFGQPRAIRTDEWLVTTPRVMSGQYSTPAYSKENNIVMAKETSNLATSGFQLGLSMLASPHNWLYATGNVAYGLSFRWGFLLLFGMLVSYEFFLIITDNKKMLSCMGMIMVMFSSIFMWWSYMIWIVYTFAIIDSIYYFVVRERALERILLAVGLAIVTSAFCVELYPAWQVPLGYFIIGMIIWITITNFDKIKRFKLKDVYIIIVAFVILVTIMASFIHDNMQYIEDVMQTVYPGHREEYGRFVLTELFYYVQTLMYPFVDIGNSSEAGVFYSFFPVPIMLAIWLWVKNKNKGEDKLTPILLILALLYGGYCCFEYPHVIAKVLLLTYSTPERMADILGFIMVILLVYLLGKYEIKDMLNPAGSFAISAITVTLSSYVCKKSFPNYMTTKNMLILWLIGFVALFCLMVNDTRLNFRKIGCIIVSIVILVSGVCVHPLMRGVSVLYTKPLEKKIASLVEDNPNGVWIGMDNMALPSILIANGAPTLDCVNYVPNFELWDKIDPDGNYEELWNRYAHVDIGFTNEDTEVILNYGDSITVMLSYKDIPNADIDYVVCAHKLESNEWVTFEKIYKKHGMYIYHVNY